MQPSVAWIDHIDRQFILGHKHARSRLVNAFYNYIYQAGKSALENNVFPGQRLTAKLNHILLYLSILIITISGALKKLFNGEMLDLFLFDIEIKDNFELAESFYDIHILSNYTLIALISLHIFAVIIHKVIFKENLLKKIL